MRTSVAQNERFITKQVPGSVAVTMLRMGLDPGYRERVIKSCMHALFHNKRYVYVLDELRQQYGYKIDEFHDFIFEQMGFDFERGA